MTAPDILQQLKSLGQESVKNILLKHGIQEPLYGVKIEELKKILKQVKANQAIAMELYDTGVYDAMYLAGLMAEPAKMKPKDLQHWANNATSPTLREYTVAWVAAESGYGMEKAMEWIDAKDEHIASIGWATLSSILTITPDDQLDIPLLQQLLERIVTTIDKSPDRVKRTMNAFVMAAGIHVKELNGPAKQAAIKMGKITIDMGDTACKLPAALDYIAKAEGKGGIGKKKKSARC